LFISYIGTKSSDFQPQRFDVHSGGLFAVSLITTFGTLSGLTFTRPPLSESLKNATPERGDWELAANQQPTLQCSSITGVPK
jgi:hypothetical protein